ncbi:hypothetical protein [Hansschlegelia zhihuaiae]|uniref:hypothetical protein n=1 Tax=Hansschlegelia zhihuaiae TaxID=405005 RepID=UPI0013E8F566|nr:hypothetical protein [Hansschlegelia zhihuaiae]
MGRLGARVGMDDDYAPSPPEAKAGAASHEQIETTIGDILAASGLAIGSRTATRA